MSDAFDRFIEGMFMRYTQPAGPTNREFVIARSRHAIRILEQFVPQNLDQEINLETALELYADLIRKAGGED